MEDIYPKLRAASLLADPYISWISSLSEIAEPLHALVKVLESEKERTRQGLKGPAR